MIVCKTTRYRVYPTASQEARLSRWESALRFLWNLAHEQRLMGLRRTDKRYPSAFEQHKELTELRAALPWLADVPRDVCESCLVELDLAWRRYFSKLAGMPRWKKKGMATPGLTGAHANNWRVSATGRLHFPKLGSLRLAAHKQLDGRPRLCTLKRDGDQWFASISCEVTISDPSPRTDPVLALDRGITNLLADSDGNLTTNPKHYDDALRRLARAQRALSRKKKGSKNCNKAKVRVMRIHRKVRRQRERFLHCLSSTITKSNGVVVIEKLNVAGMVKARPLARSIASAGWSQFAHMLRYKLAWSGGTLVEVPAQYSSQTCSACDVVDAASRKADRFDCTACGHRDHADLNAAKVLKTRANRSGKPGDGNLLEGSERTRKEATILRATRKKLPKVAAAMVADPITSRGADERKIDG